MRRSRCSTPATWWRLRHSISVAAVFGARLIRCSCHHLRMSKRHSRTCDMTATLDATGFSNMTLGATANTFASRLIFDALSEPTPFNAWLDIRADLDATGNLQCDGISLTLELGGVAE